MQKPTRNRIGAILLALALGVAGVTWPLSASAIEYGGIGGRPANPDPKVPRSDSIFIYSLAGSAQKSDAITLLNNTDQPKTLKVYATDALVSSGGALSCRQEVEPKDEVGSWIALSQSSVTLAPFSNQAVPFTVTVPANASPGEHNGCIAVQEQNQQPQQQAGGIALSTRTALRVAVTVPGEITRTLEITGHTIGRNPKGDYFTNLKVKNAGNVSVEADVKATTRYVFGLKQQQAGGTFSLLPNVEADYNFEIKRPFWGLFYLSQASATYQPDLNSDRRKTVHGPTRIFWVWPQPVAAAIEVLGLLILAGGAWAVRRRREQQVAFRTLKSYTVKRGETLDSLADRYGVSVRRLAKINAVTPDYALKARQRIKVPAKSVTSSRSDALSQAVTSARSATGSAVRRIKAARPKSTRKSSARSARKPTRRTTSASSRTSRKTTRRAVSRTTPKRSRRKPTRR